MSEINVTPFVDVMLVLLIVFMVSAPLMTAGIPLQLPETAAQPASVEATEPVTVNIDAQGRIYVQNAEAAEPDLVAGVQAGFDERGGADRKVYLRADASALHGAVSKILGALNAGGFREIVIVALAAPGRP